MMNADNNLLRRIFFHTPNGAKAWFTEGKLTPGDTPLFPPSFGVGKNDEVFHMHSDRSSDGFSINTATELLKKKGLLPSGHVVRSVHYSPPGSGDQHRSGHFFVFGPPRESSKQPTRYRGRDKWVRDMLGKMDK